MFLHNGGEIVENKGDKSKNDDEIIIRVLPGLSELKYREIVEHLLEKVNSVSAAMDLVQDIVEEMEEIDSNGTAKFFSTVNRDAAESEGQDFLIVNSKLVDWKQLDRKEVLGELIELAINSMSSNKNKQILIKKLGEV